MTELNECFSALLDGVTWSNSHRQQLGSSGCTLKKSVLPGAQRDPQTGQRSYKSPSLKVFKTWQSHG